MLKTVQISYYEKLQCENYEITKEREDVIPKSAINSY